MSTTEVQLCSRCKTEPSVTVSRKEPFCSQCFIRFITGKQRKAMAAEKFKIQFSKDPKKEHILFPCSFGASSLVLLDILLCLMNEQNSNPRGQVGFHLSVVYLDDSSFEKHDTVITDVINAVKEKYQTQNLPVTFEVVDMDGFFEDSENLRKISVNLDDYQTHIQPLSQSEHSFALSQLLQALPNRASRHDILQIVKAQLIQSHIIKSYNSSDSDSETPISTVLYAHNMTTMANEVLSLTVKGRGAEIHKLLTDSVLTLPISSTQTAQLGILHPLKDITSTEIQTYLTLLSLTELELKHKNQPTLMNKQKTINEIVNEYYKDVDVDHTGNIISTVVSTGGKLGDPLTLKKNDGSNESSTEQCIICHTSINGNPSPDKWLSAISYTSKLPPLTDLQKQSYSEWVESCKPSVNEENHEPPSQDQNQTQAQTGKLCYGCIVTVGGVKKADQDGFVWPVVTKERYDVDDVLKEFSLD
ncbi:hypothetical protein WICPIJ_002691 [Wickerhamomyces pijperi]|uniref:Cytoplasmic tRNA 2-thiolation protein 2 n=1 Tax=Wickerhamomyces pijperi TaxID=599730 RepID=A0A9P8TPL3_WICPI|nr:hypothetical protein WICPIJ_002691 [Wickerhamomyces pijperi]